MVECNHEYHESILEKRYNKELGLLIHISSIIFTSLRQDI